MPTVYKTLGQSNPAATTATTLYTVPNSSTDTVVSTITVCNQASTAGTFRIAVRQYSAALAAQHYIAYDTPIAANDTIALTLGLTLDHNGTNGDIVSVYASSANMSFSAFGSEIS